MIILRAVFTLAALTSLAGCLSSVLPKSADRAQYTLPAAAPMKARQRLPLALLVDTPRAIAPLDGSDIAVIRSDGEVQLLAGARWTAALPILLQDLLARSIEAAGVVPAVAQSAAAQRLPLRITGELRAFELHESPTGLNARAALQLRLICNRDARVLASSTQIHSEAGDLAGGSAAAVAGLRGLASDLARQTVLWLQEVDVSSCVDR